MSTPSESPKTNKLQRCNFKLLDAVRFTKETYERNGLLLGKYIRRLAGLVTNIYANPKFFNAPFLVEIMWPDGTVNCSTPDNLEKTTLC